MTRILVLLIIELFSGISSNCQTTDSVNTSFLYRNSIQLELYGHALGYSFNYERVLHNGQNFKTTAQSGFAFLPSRLSANYVVPVLVNELFSFNKHHFETGLGADLITETHESGGTDFFYFITGKVGYRFQEPDGRLCFRVAFTPLIQLKQNNDPYEFFPWAGFSFGYNFGDELF